MIGIRSSIVITRLDRVIQNHNIAKWSDIAILWITRSSRVMTDLYFGTAWSLRLFLNFVLLLLVLTTNADCRSQWTSVRGNASGSACIEYTQDKDINEWFYSAKRVRRYKPGVTVWTSPALAVVGGNPMAFIGGYDQILHALDLVQKRVVWKKLTNKEILTAPVVGKIEGLDVVFWGSSDRTVYAYTAYNGKRIWTKELVSASSTLGDVYISSPCVTENMLYVSCFYYDKSLPRNEQKGYLYGLNIKTGQVVLKQEINTGQLSSPVVFIVKDKVYIAVAARRGLIKCFELKEDELHLKWTFQMSHEVLGSLVYNSGLLFLGSKYGNFIAINAVTGKEVWQRMAGNWIDNTAAVGKIDGEDIVFVGSHDYKLYAFKAETGEMFWSKVLGGEIHSAPCFFYLEETPMVAIAALDNHLYVLNARTGKIVNSYFTGNPIWDKLSKGENLWGSPAAVSAGKNTVLVYGSFNNTVYVVPVAQKSSLQAQARSVKSLWISLLVVCVVFLGIVVPVVTRSR